MVEHSPLPWRESEKFNEETHQTELSILSSDGKIVVTIIDPSDIDRNTVKFIIKTVNHTLH